jgi:hypothetical protein
MSDYLKCKNSTTDLHGQNGQKHGIETTGPCRSVSARGKIKNSKLVLNSELLSTGFFLP